MNRKEMKQRAKASLKKHYVIFLITCLIGMFVGSEFSSSLSFTEVESSSASDINAVSNSNMGAVDVLEDIAQGDDFQGKLLAEELTDNEVQDSESGSNPFLGRSRGVLAMLINGVTSGTIYVKLAAGMNSIIKSEDAVAAILVVLSLFFTVGLWFLLQNMFQVVSRRIFLEGRVYERLTMQRFLYLLRLKKWVKVSWTMFVAFALEMLWWLTLVGGIIKHFSYYMVPYIVAENPDIGPLKAITLSRKMMKGHKWECFVLSLSFLGWDCLSLLTFGLLEVLFLAPYKQATYAEYFVNLRSIALGQKLEGSLQLNDTYLYEKADEQLLLDTYSEVVNFFKNPPVAPEKRTGIRAFFANFFGIVFLSSHQEKRREEWEAKELKLHALLFSMEGQSYPGRLSPIPEHNKRSRIETVNYLRHYTIWSLVLFFFIFSFIGWVWEVSLHLISDGVFVNRGVLQGPWLPIYGSGGVLILVALYRFRKNVALQFFTTVVLCGCVEYFSSWYLEMAHNGKKWWDYSGYFLNLNGRICAEGLFVFGVGGMAIVYAVAPLLDNWLKKIPRKILIPLCIVLVSLFVVDQVYSGKHPNTGHGITDYETGYLEDAGRYQREEA